MSFVCAVTKKPSKPREKAIKIVVETRPVTYVNTNADGDPIMSSGHEIVKEIMVTQAGLDIIKKLNGVQD